MGRTDTDKEIAAHYEQYASLVHRRCKYILGSEDEAWDATQEVFIKLMNNLHTIKNQGSIYSWLLSTSTHLCISMLRKKSGSEFDEEVHSSDNESLRHDHRAAIKDVLAKVMQPWNSKIREVLIYSFVDEYTQPEIARLTGLGESTIRKYLALVKKKSQYLRPLLAE
jgi:RNA polymerase sigma-70 factor, ECF subfamily